MKVVSKNATKARVKKKEKGQKGETRKTFLTKSLLASNRHSTLA